MDLEIPTPMHDFQTSLFTNFTTNKGTAPLHKVLASIKADTVQSQISQIRKLTSEGHKEAADKLKQQLPAFTPSGVFKDGRRLELLEQYTPIICLDFDNVNGTLNILQEKVNALPYTYCSFVSPRGNGLKVIVITDATQEHHTLSFNQIADFYEHETGIKSDRSVKDIPRLCFLSYDPDLYLNMDSMVFEIKPERDTITINAVLKEDNIVTIDNCVMHTEKKCAYTNGDRNNFIYRLACNCNNNGVPINETIDYCASRYDLSIKEIETTINSAYRKYSVDFGKFANFAKLQNENKSVPDDSFLKNSPNISEELYAQMPELLQEGVNAFTDRRERDVYFTGALAILSGCLPNVQGIYSRETVYPNLFTFIIAPPASGKRGLKFARSLGDKTQKHYLENNEEQEKIYQRRYRAYIQRQKRDDADPNEEPPEKPQFNVLFIPANSSYAKILYHLHQNEGAGIICETEADTMGNILKQEWGSYSDMLRKAFHHEPLSSSRKASNEYIEIPEPKLSVALTGTPGQIAGLISSAEDGLFSRFFFYVFKSDQIWNDVSPNANGVNLTDHFGSLSDKVYDMINFMKETKMRFFLTTEQWAHLNNSFSYMLTDVTVFTSENAGSIVKRLGLLLYRIAMIFTALRKWENKSHEVEMYCSDADFLLSMHLSELYLKHSLIMYNNLPKEDESVIFSESHNKKAFFNALPDKFTRSEAIKIAEKYNMCDRTVDGFLKKLISIHLSKPSTGKYEKITKNQ